MIVSTENHSPDHTAFLAGKGNWTAFNRSVDEVFEAAESWKRSLDGVELPWLCWNVDPDWCLLQQKLVEAVGWTPVVGADPRAKEPVLTGKAIRIDFNAAFQFPTMYPHFPLEFVFRFANRLAFWHSDLLIRIPRMQQIAQQFAEIPDGEMAAVPDRGGIRGLLKPRKHRYWELIGCTTRGASQNQFEHGCGWWMEFYNHPNFIALTERERRRFYWDYGIGIMQWTKKHGGLVHAVPERSISEGHFTRINNPSYELASPTVRRDLSKDLSHNFELAKCANLLGLDEFIEG